MENIRILSSGVFVVNWVFMFFNVVGILLFIAITTDVLLGSDKKDLKDVKVYIFFCIAMAITSLVVTLLMV